MALSGNAATIAQFWQSKGLSSAGVAGILGTWQAESSLNPGITNSIGAHGLAQWLGSRRIALQGFASRLGTNENNLNAQLEFAWSELQQPQYAGLLHLLQTTNDPRAAATAFVNQYERPGPGGDAGAPGYAATFYAGGVPGGSGHPSAGGGGGTATPVGNSGGGGLPWWMGITTPFGPLVTGQHPVIPGTAGVAEAIGGIATDIGTFFNMIGTLFHPSFWLRVGGFLSGIVFLFLGFKVMQGASNG